MRHVKLALAAACFGLITSVFADDATLGNQDIIA
jgi:hypothetical protein